MELENNSSLFVIFEVAHCRSGGPVAAVIIINLIIVTCGGLTA
jgi:hypothetical protein